MKKTSVMHLKEGVLPAGLRDAESQLSGLRDWTAVPLGGRRRRRKENLGPLGTDIVAYRQSQIDYPFHSHDFSELVIITAGQGIHRFGGKEYPIATGDVFVMAPGEGHAYLDTKNLVLINILFDMARLRLPLRDVGQMSGFHALFTMRSRPRRSQPARLRLSAEELAVADDLAARLCRELYPPRPGSQFAAAAIFMTLIVHLARCYEKSDAHHLSLKLGRAIGLIEQHYQNPISRKELTKVACVSPRTLTRYFRDAVGLSPIEYLVRHRVMRAAAMLRETPLSVTEIAGFCGFSDSNYFSRQFRSVMSASPREFRKRFRGAAG